MPTALIRRAFQGPRVRSEDQRRPGPGSSAHPGVPVPGRGCTAGVAFPSPAGPMLTDFRKVLDRVAIAAGFWEYVLDSDGQPVKDAEREPVQRGTVRSKMFRHSWCSARLQTLDHGAPVSSDVVRREMGHESPRLVERIYGHLGTVRHRSEVVEYRIEQHQERLGDRLKDLVIPGTV